MAAEVWLETRPKGRPPRWAFRVTAGGAVAFESSRVAIRFGVEADAAWLAGLVDALVARGESPGQPGRFAGIRWEGDLGDDCWAALGEMHAHAEHMQGPRRGGAWYCSVERPGHRLFHTADCGARPRSGASARWLCELVMRSERSGSGA